MVIKEESNSKVVIKEIAIIKKIHNFIEFFNPEIKILSINLKGDILEIYINNCSTILQTEIQNIQKDITIYLSNEFEITLNKVNVIII